MAIAGRDEYARKFAGQSPPLQTHPNEKAGGQAGSLAGSYPTLRLNCLNLFCQFRQSVLSPCPLFQLYKRNYQSKRNCPEEA